MVKNLTWPQGSQRELLEWVDARRGPQSPLITNEKEAIRSLTELLDTNHEFGKKRLPTAEVRRKLDSFWTHRLLPQFSSAKIDVFYREGSNALNRKILEDSIGNDYEEGEITIYRAQLNNSQRTPNEPSTNAAHDDDGAPIEEPGTVLSPTVHGDANGTSSGEEAPRPKKRAKMNPPSGNSDENGAGLSDAAGPPTLATSAGQGQNTAPAVAENLFMLVYSVPIFEALFLQNTGLNNLLHRG